MVTGAEADGASDDGTVVVSAVDVGGAVVVAGFVRREEVYTAELSVVIGKYGTGTRQYAARQVDQSCSRQWSGEQVRK